MGWGVGVGVVGGGGGGGGGVGRDPDNHQDSLTVSMPLGFIWYTIL